MNIILKNLKQYSYELDDSSLDELSFIGRQYMNVKNYVYSRYSGIKNILLLNKDRDIRDEWVKSKFAEQWKLPARYWKLALSEAISNIKSKWSNIKNKIKNLVKNNENLSNEDKHYINYILKFNDYFYKILTHVDFDVPKIFANKALNFKYLHNLINRYTRKCKGKIPYSNNNTTFSADTGLYKYNDGHIFISTAKKGKRSCIKLKDRDVRNNTLKIKIVGKKLEIHGCIKIKTKTNKNPEKIIGIDKGYRHLFATSSGNLYGERLNNFLSSETERLNLVNSSRNRFYVLENKYREEGNVKKADNILYNNLGKEKYNRNKSKHDATVKAYINYGLNELIRKEKPTEIVMEELDFINWNNRYPKTIKRKLSRWIKGYIRERLEYKSSYNEIRYTYINPAYTSKACSRCGGFGERNGDNFTCPKCGKMHADINASINILNRKYDKEIKLYTGYKEVKKILERRLSN